MPTTISSNPTSFGAGATGPAGSVRFAFFNEGYTRTGSEVPGDPVPNPPLNLLAFREGGGIVPASGTTFDQIGAGTAGDPLRLSQFSGLTVPSLVTFTPEGGASVGTAVYLISDEPYGQAVLTVSCTQNAVWTYTKTFDSGNGNEFVSLASGGTDTSITFTLDSLPGWDFQLSRRVWNLSATSGGITQYWQINLRSDYT
jgi:hypothetical protein